MQSFFQCGRYRFKLDGPEAKVLVMGILNVTPDSFSDGGQYQSLEAAVSRAEQMIADGVDIIDIGGESSRPGAESLTVQEELRRVLPAVFALRDCGVPLSIDTVKPEVMYESLAAGADMINDIHALRTPGALSAVKGSDCGLCIMHMQNNPQTMQQRPQYDDAVQEVTQFLRDSVEQLSAAGIARARLCIDPGFGFGKTLEHNLALLRHCGQMQRELGLPLLAGMSRKSMIGQLTGKAVDQRLGGSVAAALAAVAQGAKIVRVHDVAATVDAITVWQAVGAM